MPAATQDHSIHQVAATGRVVAIRYVGARGGAGGEQDSIEEATQKPANARQQSGPYLTLCTDSVDWLCAAARSSRARAARFELLPLVSADGAGSSVAASGNRTGNVSSGSSGESSNSSSSANTTTSRGMSNDAVVATTSFSGGVAFALRSLATGRLVQVAPLEDDEAWVVRARGEPRPRAATAGDGGGAGGAAANTTADLPLQVTALELWEEEGEALRNVGTGALLNFRGDAEGGDGVAVRAHGDTKPRRAARERTPRTRFVLRRAQQSQRRTRTSAPV